MLSVVNVITPARLFQGTQSIMWRGEMYGSRPLYDSDLILLGRSQNPSPPMASTFVVRIWDENVVKQSSRVGAKTISLNQRPTRVYRRRREIELI